MLEGKHFEQMRVEIGKLHFDIDMARIKIESINDTIEYAEVKDPVDLNKTNH